jgi:ribosomal protein S26
VGGIVERQKELRRRRKRRQKIKIIKRKLEKATPSEKAVMATKIRNMTPGAEVIIANLGLEERK